MATTNSTDPTNKIAGFLSLAVPGLLWGCFATIFICTWSAIHPNVPKDTDTSLQVLGRRTGLLLGAIVAPEALTYFAYDGLYEARKLKDDLPEWSLKQRFFLAMGGYSIQTDPTDKRSRIRITCAGLIELWRKNAVDWPETEDSEIDNCSKADWFTKSIALVQVLWFTIELVARAIQHMPITTLELFTAGIVICTAITYAFWWEKPFDVRKPVILYPSNSEIATVNNWPKNVKRIGFLRSIDPEYERNSNVALLIATVLFGGLHLAAWQFHFPSVAEKWLWRASAISSMVLPAILGIANIRSTTTEKFDSVLYLLFIVVRMYMFFEMLVGLRAVPHEVYQVVQWSQYFPSFG